MATQVQWRGGSTAEHATFTGAAREVTVDTQKQTLVLHDGSTAGGEALLREDQANLPGSVTNGIYTPGTNQVAVATNGTGRLFVDASGRVGVGSSGTPTHRFHVRDSNDGGEITVACVENNGSLASTESRLLFVQGGNTTRGAYVGGLNESDAGQPTSFVVGTSAAYAGPTERLRITSAGNVGIGTTTVQSLLHLATSALVDLRFTDTGEATDQKNWAFQAGTGVGAGTFRLRAINDANSSGENAYVITKSGTSIQTHQWLTGGSERARIDSSGRLLIGTASTSTNLRALIQATSANSAGGGNLYLARGESTPADGASLGYLGFSDSNHTSAAGLEAVRDGGTWTSGSSQPSRLVFSTTADGASTPTERMRINSQGSVRIGGTGDPGAAHIIEKPGVAVGTQVLTVAGADESLRVYNASSFANPNGAAMVLWVRANNTTSRSINAAGTVNASGADYAEYMVKAGDFTISKGAICGITADGLLTVNYDDAASFGVKSTNPSYVGGDTWGAGFEDDPEGLETARQAVDRVAFAGQVPVNVMGATPGEYIIPAATEDGGIMGISKNEADLTLSEYMRAVGKVIAIEDDGRARIIVKVA